MDKSTYVVELGEYSQTPRRGRAHALYDMLSTEIANNDEDVGWVEQDDAKFGDGPIVT
jgi:hypothetical protein